MTRLHVLNVAKVTPVALTPVAVLIWVKPRLGSTDSSQSIEDAVTASLWWLAIVLGVWLAGSVVIWAAIDGDKGVRSSTWLDRLTLPGSRRVAQVMLTSAAFAISACSADATTAPVLRAVDTIAVADETPDDATSEEPPNQDQQVTSASAAPPSPSSLDSHDVESVGEDDTKPPVEPPPLEVGVDPHPLVETTQSSAVPPTQHTVSAGENLWSIAQTHVLEHDAGATGGDIATYWRALISANTDSLRSGEPSLIYVGETLRLPEFAAG